MEGRHPCSKTGCESPAVFELKVYVDKDGEKTHIIVPFCLSHALDASGVIESIVQNLMGAGE